MFYYLRVFFSDVNYHSAKYKFKSLDTAYLWLSSNKWEKFILNSELPGLFKEDEFKEPE